MSVAHAFLGIQLQCAECHKHPFDVWSKQDFAEFSNFFTGIRFGATPPAKEDRETYNKMLNNLGLKGDVLMESDLLPTSLKNLQLCIKANHILLLR